MMCKKDIIIGIYVDDIFIIGEEKAIDEFEEGIKRNFEVRSSDNINEFIGVEMKWKRKRIGSYISSKKNHSKVINKNEK